MSERPEHVVERDYKRSSKRSEDQKSADDGSGSSWFVVGYIGLGACLIMSTACDVGSCGRWASEIWLGLGLICVAIAVGGLKV
jgi:hypothetical protein